MDEGNTHGVYSARIRDLPSEERPREKLERYGPRSLSNQELLAIILRTGTKGVSALTLADRLLHRMRGIRGIAQADIADLARVDGIGKVKAIQVAACLELGRRLGALQPEDVRQEITSPEAVADLLMPEMRDLKTEELRVLILDTKHRFLRSKTVSIGTLDASLVHPREVFREAIAASAGAIIVAHNHPSGDPTPSTEDRAVTERLRQASELIGIALLDHIIIGGTRWVSMRRVGLL